MKTEDPKKKRFGRKGAEEPGGGFPPHVCVEPPRDEESVEAAQSAEEPKK